MTFGRQSPKTKQMAQLYESQCHKADAGKYKGGMDSAAKNNGGHRKWVAEPVRLRCSVMDQIYQIHLIFSQGIGGEGEGEGGIYNISSPISHTYVCVCVCIYSIFNAEVVRVYVCMRCIHLSGKFHGGFLRILGKICIEVGGGWNQCRGVGPQVLFVPGRPSVDSVATRTNRRRYATADVLRILDQFCSYLLPSGDFVGYVEKNADQVRYNTF